MVVTGTNLGLEGITYVPDALLVEAGWKVGGVAYTAAAHPTPGLFVTAVEGTGDLHFFSLPTGAAPVEVKVEKSGFPFAMDVAYDADREALWALCDDSCGGIYNLLEIVDGEFTVDSYARPDGMPNLNNEGMALAPWSTCVEGVQEVVWADDGDTDGHSLRAGTLPCNEFQLENTALPRIQGTPKVGMTLTGTPGSWDPEPGSVAHHWLANGAPIAGATGPKLAVTMALVGKRITLRVTASADGLDDVSEVSAPTAPVAKGTFTVRVRPGIAGKARVDMTLRAVKGAVSPAADRASYQWLLNGKRIKGATGVTLRLKPKFQGKKVSVRVTFARPGYVAKTLTSKAVRVRQR